MRAAAASRGHRRRASCASRSIWQAFKDGPQDRLLNVENFENTAPLWCNCGCVTTARGFRRRCLPKIFQPYFTTKGLRQGTGLGLNIVQRLIKEARGALHVHTQVGKGRSFTVYLPAVPLATA